MYTRMLLFIILLSILPSATFAGDKDEGMALKLFVKSGTEKQLEQLPLVIIAGLDQTNQQGSTGKISAKVFSIIKSSAKDVFSLEKMKGPIISAIGERLTDQEIKEVLAWLDSPTGKRITRMEEEASTAEAEAEKEAYISGAKSSSRTTERLKILKKLDLAGKITESAVEMNINIQAAVAMAVNATYPKERQRTYKDISRDLEKLRPDLETSVRSQILTSLLYTYRELTDAELEKYIEFTTTPAGEKYNSTMIAAIQSAFYSRSIELGNVIGKTLQQEEKQLNI